MENTVLGLSTKTKDKIEISDSVIYYEVLKKLGDEYDSPNIFDSDVENAWEEYANKKTNHPEWNFF
jgi:hypothetical protein